MEGNKYTIENGRLIIKKKLYSSNDTQIFSGIYYGKECIIKRINIDKQIGINSKTLREISFLKRHHHPNIVKLYGIYCDDEYVYIILEKGVGDICNMTRDELIKYNVLNDVLNGLKFMEDCGYIHGDLNFKNIVMFDQFGKKTFKLVDFGSTTKVYRIDAIKRPTCYISPVEMLECTKTNMRINTSPNIFPEKIDSWAFGCLLYYVETGDIVVDKGIYNVIEEINYADKNIKYLLSSDANSRYTIGEFYNFKKNKHSNTTNFVKIDELFKNIKKNSINLDTYRNTKNEVLQEFLMLDVLNNISIENIFITFDLVDKTNYKTTDEYILNNCVLFYVSTKLVCMKEFTCSSIINLINKKIAKKIKSVSHFNKIVFDVLTVLNWDIDITTQISFATKLTKDTRIKYIIISLCILCDNKLRIFSNQLLHNVIMTLLELEKGNHNAININAWSIKKNKHRRKYYKQFSKRLLSPVRKSSLFECV